jgi:hypothetical protein
MLLLLCPILLLVGVTLSSEWMPLIPYHLARKIQHIGTGLVWLGYHESIPTFLPIGIGMAWYHLVRPKSRITHDNDVSFDPGITVYIILVSLAHLLVHYLDCDPMPFLIMFLADPMGYIGGTFSPYNIRLLHTPTSTKSLVGCISVFTTTALCCTHGLGYNILNSMVVSTFVTAIEFVGGAYDNLMIGCVCIILMAIGS